MSGSTTDGAAVALPAAGQPDSRFKAAGGRAAALAGVLAVAVALGAAELLAGLLAGSRSLIVAVGDVVIDNVPGWLERSAIAALGTSDKPVLIASILIVSALLGALLGLLAARRFAAGAAVIVACAVIGAVAELTDPQSRAVAVIAVALGYALSGVLALRLLLRAARPRTEPVPAGPASPDPEPASAAEPMTGGGADRRHFLMAAAGAAVAAGLSGAAGRWLAGRQRVAELRSAIRLPRPARPAPPAPAGASLDIRGLSSLYTPNAGFYRIDTALLIPQVDPTDWSLSVRGRVDRPFRLTYAELMELPQIEVDITLACVSNVVGGGLVGNARWQGVPLRSLLERAGVHPGATQIVGHSVDGFTAGFPTAVAMAQKDALVAVGMNGEPLPIVHGFPARLVIPGLYGYVSATKWLSAIELSTWEDTVGYWIPRGWSREGPIKTQSRIDVPKRLERVSPGRRPIAGVAWAPTRGISRVEVSVDDGPWVEAELADQLDVDCWRQWVHVWDATPGQHRITVRATDGDGVVQTPALAPVAPNGASGHHMLDVQVKGA